MTMQVLIKNKLTTLSVMFQRREEGQSRHVDKLFKLAKKYVKIKAALLDRGFRGVKILNNPEYRHAPVLMPMVKDEKGEKCLEEPGKRNLKAIKFSLMNKKREYADVRLLMIRLNNGKEIGFYTTLNFIWLHTVKYKGNNNNIDEH